MKNSTLNVENSIPDTVEKFDGTWIVEKITDLNIEDLDEMRLDFVAGKLYGLGPCRSFQMTFGPDTQNMMFGLPELGGGMCEEQAMNVERDFFNIIAFVNRMEIADDGQLVMYNLEKPLLWAKPFME